MSESITSTAARAKPGRPRRRKRPRNADPQASTRVEILKSAAAAFRRRGYHGASMGEIAQALHTTKGSLYYYFKNKEEILFFCHDYSLDILLELLARVEKEGGSPADKLRELVAAFVHHILDDLRGTAMTLEFQALSPRACGRSSPSATASTAACGGSCRRGWPAGTSRAAIRSCWPSRCWGR